MFKRRVVVVNGDGENMSLYELTLSGLFRVGLSFLISDIEKSGISD